MMRLQPRGLYFIVSPVPEVTLPHQQSENRVRVLYSINILTQHSSPLNIVIWSTACRKILTRAALIWSSVGYIPCCMRTKTCFYFFSPAVCLSSTWPSQASWETRPLPGCPHRGLGVSHQCWNTSKGVGVWPHSVPEPSPRQRSTHITEFLILSQREARLFSTVHFLLTAQRESKKMDWFLVAKMLILILIISSIYLRSQPDEVSTLIGIHLLEQGIFVISPLSNELIWQRQLKMEGTVKRNSSRRLKWNSDSGECWSTLSHSSSWTWDQTPSPT